MKSLHLTSIFIVILLVLTSSGFSQAGVDREPPEINILSPKSGGRHSYFPAISAKVIDRSYTGIYGEQVHASGVGSVKFAIWADGMAWNGSGWFPVTNPKQGYVLTPQASGENWELKSGLPSSFKKSRTDPKQPVTSYTVYVLARDNAGNERHDSVWIGIKPLEIAFVDANREFSGVDLSDSDTRRPLSESELVSLTRMVSWGGAGQSYVSGTVDPQAMAASYTQMMNSIRQRIAALRIGAVADGTTKILVIAKGHDPGLVTFRSSAEAKHPEKCTTITKHGTAPVLPVSDSTFEFLGNVKEMRAALDAAQRRLYGFRVCATGPLSGDKLTEINSNAAADNVQAIKVGDSEYYWFALYTVPEAIDPTVDNSFLGQQISFETSIIPNAGAGRNFSTNDGFVNSMAFYLKRPPVLLVHGMNDYPTSWQTNTVLEDAHFDVRYVDYGSTNNRSFKVNQYAILRNSLPSPVPAPIPFQIQPDIQGTTILATLKGYRHPLGYAISKVDVVGHSMGGILARLTTQLPGYETDDNLGKGYIRRLITIGTPHLGSNISNVLVAKRAEYKCADLAYNAGGPESIRDLMIGGDGVRMLRSKAVPSHAIISTAKNVKGAYYLRFLLAKTCNNATFLSPSVFDTRTTESFKDSLLAGEAGDLTVSDKSQMGGLFPPFVTVFGESDDIDHGEEIGSQKIREKVLELLKGSKDAFDPNGFPDPMTVKPQPRIGDGTSNIETTPPCPPNRPCPVPAPAPTAGSSWRLKNSKDPVRRSINPSRATGSWPGSQQPARPAFNGPQTPTLVSIDQAATGSTALCPFEAGVPFKVNVPTNWTSNVNSPLSVYFAPDQAGANNPLHAGVFVEATAIEWQSLESAVERLRDVVTSTRPYLRLIGRSEGSLSGSRSIGLRFAGINPASGNEEEFTCFSILLADRRLLYLATVLPSGSPESTRNAMTTLITSFAIDTK